MEAFTLTRYDLLHGTVTSLSQDAVAAGGSDAARTLQDNGDDTEVSAEQARQARQPTYAAQVALAATSIATEQGTEPLEPGMAVTAEIKTGRRTVISYPLSPLSRFRKKGLRER